MLQQNHPEDSQLVEYQLDAFKGYTGESGFHLPLHDKGAGRIARQLRQHKQTA